MTGDCMDEMGDENCSRCCHPSVLVLLFGHNVQTFSNTDLHIDYWLKYTNTEQLNINPVIITAVNLCFK